MSDGQAWSKEEMIVNENDIRKADLCHMLEGRIDEIIEIISRTAIAGQAGVLHNMLRESLECESEHGKPLFEAIEVYIEAIRADSRKPFEAIVNDVVEWATPKRKKRQ
jgi:hypothetical protein